jgi:hypothetical protein
MFAQRFYVNAGNRELENLCMTLIKKIMMRVLLVLWVTTLNAQEAALPAADVQAVDGQAAENQMPEDPAQPPPEEFIVRGKLPGPPLWKVQNGDNTLWIFGYFSPVPKDMEWESARVERVVATAQEYLEIPDADIKLSPLVLFNPINIVRGMRLAKRISQNDDDKTLEDVLPPALYQRYWVLKTQYFPKEDEFEEQRPLVAGQGVAGLIQREAGLVSGQPIIKKIKRIVRRNKKLKITETQLDVKIEGGYGKLADRVETMMSSIQPSQEIACFEWNIARMETELEDMKSRADSWAQGYIDEFQGVKLRRTEDDPCFSMMLASSENETIADIMSRTQQLWLAAAEQALATNASTFAVLNISELLNDDGLLAKLAEKGYSVQKPQ